MRPVQARLITLCQQTLALGVVLAVLTPASGVVSLDIVGQHPDGEGAPIAAAASLSATVPTQAVAAEVTEVSLTDDAGESTTNGRVPALGRLSARGAAGGARQVVSTPQRVNGLAAIGVTWDSGVALGEDEISVRVRTRDGSKWSKWQDVEYHDEHGPNPSSPEGRSARPGTEPMIVGDVDDVQVSATTAGTSLPADLSLALVEPGESATRSEKPALAASPTPAGEAADEDGIALRAAQAKRTVSQPTIYTRAQWGADEKIRNKKSLRYGTINAGFVHHTVNANDYSEAEVPGIIRSIYAYHVKSRGWSDIGYNFLVDRFGRIWEGRFGGIDRPVIGAHTLNYNQASFAMSAIGNFDLVEPTDAMLRAYGALFAWKLSLHGVNPASTSQTVGRGTFQAINGHRDAGKTACPGRYLYAQLATIRTYASQAAPVTTPPPPVEPIAVGTPNPQNQLVGSAHPDLVLRRASDDRAIIVPTGGLTAFNSRRVVGKSGWGSRADVLVSPDLTGDGIADLVVIDRKGVARVRAGNGSGRFGKTVRKVRLKDYSLVTAVGDANGDGRNDLVARFKGRLMLLAFTDRGIKRKRLAKGFGNVRQLVGTGDVTGDGKVDVLARTRSGFFVHAGRGNGTFSGRRALSGPWADFNRLAGGGDYTADGRSDLIGRAHDGRLYVIPQLADGSWGAPMGPTANVKRMEFLSSAGQLTGGPGPDLVGVAGDKLVVLGNRDTFDLGQPIDAGVSFAGMDLLLNAGDVNRDGLGDVIGRDTSGTLWLYAGNGQGQLAERTELSAGWGSVTELAAVGDVTGDGVPDLMGTTPDGLAVWPGDGAGNFAAGAPVAGRTQVRAGLPLDTSGFDWIISIQDMQLRRGSDFVVRERSTGRLYYYNGRVSGQSRARLLGEGMGAYNLAG